MTLRSWWHVVYLIVFLFVVESGVFRDLQQSVKPYPCIQPISAYIVAGTGHVERFMRCRQVTNVYQPAPEREGKRLETGSQKAGNLALAW